MSLIDKWREYWELTPPRKFEEWCKSRSQLTDKPEETQGMVSEFAKKTGTSADDNSISEMVMDRGLKKEQNRLVINDGIINECSLDFFKIEEVNKKPRDMDLASPHFNYLVINQSKKLFIRGAVIEFLEININGVQEVIIENSCIGHISFYAHRPLVIEIRDSWMGRFLVRLNSIVNLRIEGGWICAIDCPATYEDNPFSGSVDFEKVKLPTSKNKSILFQGAQQYRNLRSHFEKLQNGPMVGLMRAKELASERETDSGVSWVFNWIYFLASNYGRYPGRAFGWFFLFLVINFACLFWFDGGRMEVNNISPGSWQHSYKGDDSTSKMVRSALLTFQTVVNPVGIVSTKSDFQFNTLRGTIHTFVLVLFADAAFIFGSLAIRKRLKVS